MVRSLKNPIQNLNFQNSFKFYYFEFLLSIILFLSPHWNGVSNWDYLKLYQLKNPKKFQFGITIEAGLMKQNKDWWNSKQCWTENNSPTEIVNFFNTQNFWWNFMTNIAISRGLWGQILTLLIKINKMYWWRFLRNCEIEN